MSEELKTCPFCDREPKTTVMGPDNEWKCANPKCPIYGVKMLNTAWNTRPSSWIKITPEKIPDKGVKVIVVVDGKLSTGRIVDHASSGISWAVDNRLSVFNLDGTYLGVTGIYELTHWQYVILPA